MAITFKKIEQKDLESFIEDFNRKMIFFAQKIKLGNIDGLITLEKGGTGASLTAPAGDRLMFYDLSGTSVDWLALGNSLAISGTTIDTIQDIRTSATPTFLSAIFSGDNIRIGTTKTPTGVNDTGIAGTICWDSSFLYICVATDTWTRIALAW
jgi:hypothetical protein